MITENNSAHALLEALAIARKRYQPGHEPAYVQELWARVYRLLEKPEQMPSQPNRRACVLALDHADILLENAIKRLKYFGDGAGESVVQLAKQDAQAAKGSVCIARDIITCNLDVSREMGAQELEPM